MNTNLRNLESEINKLKRDLYELIKHNNLTNYNVVRCSKELDKLILEYQKISLKINS